MKSNNQEEETEETEVVYEEVPEPYTIETGDFVKVKQVLDDNAMEAITESGYAPNYNWDNFKILLMTLSCVFALVAQFYPLPFPESRPLLAVCCIMYFLISAVLQYIVMFVDTDTIMFTGPNEIFDQPLRIRSSFPKFQEFYTFIVQFKDPNSPSTTAKMYVGKYFSSKGEFDNNGFKSDIKRHIERFVKKDYLEIQYNHKSD